MTDTSLPAMVSTGTTDEPGPSLSDHWNALQSEGSKHARELIFVHYMPYARSVAAQLFGARQRNDVEFSDFLQLAYIGLIESIGRFDATREASFKTYCTPRIRGSILNGIEKLTEAQEQISFNRRRRRERLESLKAPATSERSMSTLASLATGLAIGFMLEGTGMFNDDDGQQLGPYRDGYESVAWQQASTSIQKAVATLPERTGKVIRYHYFESIPFEQIANLLGLSKGRISQIHRAGLEELRKLLQPGTSMHLTG